jgi:hypothetical protein
MRIVARLVLASAVLLGPAAGLASAVTTRDLVELSRAGLGDDVLIALLQSDGSVFRLSAADIISLKAQGLSDKVIVAMLQTRAPKPAPQVEETAQPPVVVEVHQSQSVVQNVEQPRAQVQTVYVPIAVPVAVPASNHSKQSAPAPAYWGYGGQARPGSWQAPDKKGGGPPVL